MSNALRQLLFVGLALQLLLVATVSAAFLPLGPFKPWAGYGIAVAKAVLVLWYFMEMRKEGGLVRLATVAAFAWLVIMFALSATDYLSRSWVAAYADM